MRGMNKGPTFNYSRRHDVPLGENQWFWVWEHFPFIDSTHQGNNSLFLVVVKNQNLESISTKFYFLGTLRDLTKGGRHISFEQEPETPIGVKPLAMESENLCANRDELETPEDLSKAIIRGIENPSVNTNETTGKPRRDKSITCGDRVSFCWSG